MNERKDGSFIAGFLLTICLGLIGVLIAIAIDKEETKSGAFTAFFIDCIIIAILITCIVCRHMQ